MTVNESGMTRNDEYWNMTIHPEVTIGNEESYKDSADLISPFSPKERDANDIFFPSSLGFVSDGET